MTPERKQQLQELRDKLKALSPEQKKTLLDRGIIITIDGRALSPHNTIMIYFQTPSTRPLPTVVGGFQQWKRAGKMVRKGEHGMSIWFPAGPKDEDGETISAERFYTATVFDVSQVEDMTEKTAPAPVPAMAEVA